MKKILSILTAVMLLLTGCANSSGGDVIEGGKKNDTTPTPTVAAPTPDKGKDLSFTTTTLDGQAVSFANYSGNKLIMVNLWEPWCGPCVNEMPDLNKLYKDYKDKGFVILGVFSDMDYKGDAKTIVQQKGIEYPILLSTKEFEKFATEYVPTTVFFDGEGNLLSSEPFIGGRDYNSWKTIIDAFLD